MDKDTELYLGSKPIIENKVNRYSWMYPHIGYNEFYSHANLTFMLCLRNSFNTSYNIKFNSYFSQKLEKEVLRFVIRESRYEILPSIIEENLVWESGEQKFSDWIDDLNEKSREIIKHIFSAPLRSVTNNKKRITIRSLTKYLRKKGWTALEIRHHVKDIKDKLGEFYV